MNKLKQLLASNDISNHLLCYQLCKGQGIDIMDIVKLIFHDKNYWKPSINIFRKDLYIFNFKIGIQLYNASTDSVKGMVWINGLNNHTLVDYNSKFESEEDILNTTKRVIEDYININ